MNADGSGLQRLAGNIGKDPFPVWSPDGRKIAFGGGRDDVGSIYLVNADGSGLRRLTRNPGGWDWIPVWSPAQK
jgi:TolB protein